MSLFPLFRYKASERSPPALLHPARVKRRRSEANSACRQAAPTFDHLLFLRSKTANSFFSSTLNFRENVVRSPGSSGAYEDVERNEIPSLEFGNSFFSRFGAIYSRGRLERSRAAFIAREKEEGIDGEGRG